METSRMLGDGTPTILENVSIASIVEVALIFAAAWLFIYWSTRD